MAAWVDVAGRSRKCRQDSTEAAPVNALEGVLLSDVSSVSIRLEADAGLLLDGSGQIDLYSWDEMTEGWDLAPPSIQIPPSAAGQRRINLGSFAILIPAGRMVPVCNGVGAAGGQVTVYVRCTQSMRVT